jgi:pimeloyl-ACP methyl ester carboxylesterase
MEPYDPDKTVLLVIHGLMDTPVTWVPMLNELRSDPLIRHNYQFWFYSYPSGYPYFYSALILRQDLDGMEKRFLLRKKMVVVGHSMGGCIARTLVTDTGDKLWLEAFGKSPGQTDFPPATKTLLEEALIFKHRPEIGRVVFMSAPHRGADLASNWVGRIGSMLIKTPRHLVSVAHVADARPCPGSSSPSVEAGSEQRRHSGSKQPLCYGDQQTPDYARHSLSFNRGRSGTR